MRADDAALVLGATMRLSRLVVSDDLGQWWIKDPLDKQFHPRPDGQPQRFHDRWHKYQSGLICPFCVGFWAGVGVLGTYALASKNRRTHRAWRFVAATLALNEVAAHLAIRLGDVADEE